MDNNIDHKKLAIQRSVERARQEALERQKSQEQNTDRQTQPTFINQNRQADHLHSQVANKPQNQNRAKEQNTQHANKPQGAGSQQANRTQSSQHANKPQGAGSQQANRSKPQQLTQNLNKTKMQQKEQSANQNKQNQQGQKTFQNQNASSNTNTRQNFQNQNANSKANTRQNSQSQNNMLRQDILSTITQKPRIATTNYASINGGSTAGSTPVRTTAQQTTRTTVQQPAPKYREVKQLTVAKQDPILTKVAPPKSSTIVGQQNTTKIKSNSRLQDAKTRIKQLHEDSNIPSADRLKIMFLGGVGEIGKNMTLFEYENQILVLDCGVSFPSGDMPGIDLVIPDMTYLKENAHKVIAYLITHGHEDHIGALPFALKDVKAPIYGGKLTLALLENKLKEHQIKNVHLEAVESRREYKFGKFTVEFVYVNHSIADAYAIKLSTPAGVIFHTGDFKIDYQPIDAHVIDLPRIAEIGNSGVDLLMCESTNVEYEGYTLSESVVGEKLDEVFELNSERRLFVATFSSNIYRVQQVINLAMKYNRKVSIIGRSMVNNLEAAIKIGKLDFPKSLFVDIEKVNKYEEKEILILTTGSQGEANAALSRLSTGEFGKIELGKNDTVIFSSSPIPGNESNINKVINNLYKKGALVVQDNVHASGHACVEEIKIMHSLLKPKFFIPVHGEYGHLKKHAMLAESMGMKAENIIISEIGDVVEVTKKHAKLIGKVQAGEMLVDGYGLGELTSSVIKERKLLSEEGLAIVVIGINKATSKLVAEPIVITRGFIYDDEEDELVSEAKSIVVETLENVLKTKMIDWEEAKQLVRKPLRNYFFKKTKRSPIILPVIYKI